MALLIAKNVQGQVTTYVTRVGTGEVSKIRYVGGALVSVQYMCNCKGLTAVCENKQSTPIPKIVTQADTHDKADALAFTAALKEAEQAQMSSEEGYVSSAAHNTPKYTGPHTENIGGNPFLRKDKTRQRVTKILRGLQEQ